MSKQLFPPEVIEFSSEKLINDYSKKSRIIYNLIIFAVFVSKTEMLKSLFSCSFDVFDLISSPGRIIAFLLSTTPPLLNPTRSSEHCLMPISSADSKLYMAGISLRLFHRRELKGK